MAEAESPLEAFKRSTAATLRAIAERDDVTVAYAADTPGLTGTRARLPLPPRDLAPDDAARIVMQVAPHDQLLLCQTLVEFAPERLIRGGEHDLAAAQRT